MTDSFSDEYYVTASSSGSVYGLQSDKFGQNILDVKTKKNADNLTKMIRNAIDIKEKVSTKISAVRLSLRNPHKDIQEKEDGFYIGKIKICDKILLLGN